MLHRITVSYNLQEMTGLVSENCEYCGLTEHENDSEPMNAVDIFPCCHISIHNH